MTDVHECPSPESLIAITGDDTSAIELERLEQHLEDCQSCCDKLDTLSADETTWQACQSFLQDDLDDKERFTCSVQDDFGSIDLDELLRLLAPSDDPYMLGRLGPYEISGIIGSGGMGIVLKAFDPALARFVALKVLAPRFWQDKQARERFSREARAAASIIHENVIEIYGVADFNEIPYFTMPYLRGDSLQRRLDQRGPLRIEEVLRIAMQVASGLSAAHDQGLVHRDTKPANILLSDGADRVRITDFGIAQLTADSKLTKTGLIAGTPQYMSPEQVRGETVDGRSDLFSLGSVMYSIATGQPPFDATSNFELLNRVVTANPQRMEDINPSIPTWLAAIVSKLHSPLPADRYQSAEELAEHFEQCLAAVQKPEPASPPAPVRRLDAWYRRRNRSSIYTLLLGGFLVFGIAISLAIVSTGLLTTPDAASADSIDVRGRVVDQQGAAIANTTVLAVQKTWPNGRYQQQMLKTTTDKDGEFVFEGFAQPGRQYAYLLTVISDKYLMTSEYQVIKDGKQQDAITLTAERAKPVTVRFQDPKGTPLTNVRVIPTRRLLEDGTQYLNYGQQVRTAGVSTNAKGEVRFGSWKPGEKGAVVAIINDEMKSLNLVVPENRIVSLTVEPPKDDTTPVPPGAQIHVDGRVTTTTGDPVPNVQVLAIQKTWPNNRYRQRALSTTTDASGKFRFEKFATGGKQYAFLLTVITPGYAMTSEYHSVRDGSQKEPIALKLEKAKPVKFTFTDADGNPLANVEVSPNQRNVDSSTMFISYSMHMKDVAKQSDHKGQVNFTAWKPGEEGSFHYRYRQKYGELKFKVGDDRNVTIQVPQR